MTALRRYGTRVETVFGLAGLDENSATAALGFTLHRAPTLLKTIVKALLPGKDDIDFARIELELQRHGKGQGFTDIEIIRGGIHIIFEAKKGFGLAGPEQLKKYAEKMKGHDERLLVSISAAPNDYAKKRLPLAVSGVPVCHRTWTEIFADAKKAHGLTRSPIEKTWLNEFMMHMENYMKSDRVTDNTVYVVSLSLDPIRPGNDYTWVDVVKGGRYFHRIGNNWPIDPPNYIGFRFHGKLQSIHHIDAWDITDDLPSIDALWPDTEVDHFVYRLGPPMVPSKEVSSGPIFASRYWIALDLLLSGECKTIMEALAATKKRLGIVGDGQLEDGDGGVYEGGSTSPRA